MKLCLWSGPRNVSTALMYAFAQRSDTRVVDEPLYAHYLKQSGADHPGRDDVLADMENDGEVVIRDVIFGPCDRPVRFMKQMAHHLVGLDRAFLAKTVNVLLVRDPVEMLPSLARNIPEPKLGDTGLRIQLDLLNELRDLGQDPPVLDARHLLMDPEGVLQQLCARLDLAFDPAMLVWEAGARTEDGIWAKHWYENVHRSTGFAPYKPKTEPFPQHLGPLLEECKPCYQALLSNAIR